MNDDNFDNLTNRHVSWSWTALAILAIVVPMGAIALVAWLVS